MKERWKEFEKKNNKMTMFNLLSMFDHSLDVGFFSGGGGGWGIMQDTLGENEREKQDFL